MKIEPDHRAMEKADNLRIDAKTPLARLLSRMTTTVHFHGEVTDDEIEDLLAQMDEDERDFLRIIGEAVA